VLIDFHPVWSRDGKELMYVPAAASSQIATVPVAAREGLTFGLPAPSPFTITADRLITESRAYDVLPDSRFVGLTDSLDPEESRLNAPSEIRVVLNWFEELKSRIPPPPL
jgi:hypothetical protein